MTILDAPLRKVANTVGGKLGRTATYTHKSGGSYSTTTGTKTPTTSTETIKGVIGRYRQGEFGDTVRESDFPFTVDALQFDTAPDQGDSVTIDSAVYEVVDTGPIYSGDQVAAYRLQLRR